MAWQRCRSRWKSRAGDLRGDWACAVAGSAALIGRVSQIVAPASTAVKQRRRDQEQRDHPPGAEAGSSTGGASCRAVLVVAASAVHRPGAGRRWAVEGRGRCPGQLQEERLQVGGGPASARVT